MTSQALTFIIRIICNSIIILQFIIQIQRFDKFVARHDRLRYCCSDMGANTEDAVTVCVQFGGQVNVTAITAMMDELVTVRL